MKTTIQYVIQRRPRSLAFGKKWDHENSYKYLKGKEWYQSATYHLKAFRKCNPYWEYRLIKRVTTIKDKVVRS